MLQAAGLLDGKTATTHWKSLERLKKFNKVNVVERRFVHDDNLWISAGISAGIDMAFEFIAEVSGEKTAGDIQLQTEYYPQTRIYPNHNEYLPAYVDID